MKKTIIILVAVSFAILFFIFMNESDKDKTENISSTNEVDRNQSKDETLINEVDRNQSKDETSYKNLEIIKYLIKNKNTQENKIFKNMEEVVLTDGLKVFFDNWFAGYEKIDYRLRFFDRLRTCLGDSVPKSGDLTIMLGFDIDHEQRTGVGRDNFNEVVGFKIQASTLNELENELIKKCAIESHVGYIMDADKILQKIDTNPNPNKTEFYHPIPIHFPMNDDEIYWILSHDGQTRQTEERPWPPS